MSPHDEPIDSAIRIVTPENIAFRYEIAGPFRRLPAFFIDLSLRVVIVCCLFFVVVLVGIASAGALSAGFGFSIIILAVFVLEWFYGGLFETYWNGQTPGKRLMGLRVLTVDGRPINGLQAIMRNILRAVDMMPLLPWSAFNPEWPGMAMVPTFMLGLTAMMLNRRFQRLGDMVCGTIVVVEDRSWLFGVSKIEDARAAQLAEYIPPNFLINRQLSRALATYVERRKFFSPARRREIARHLAQPLLERFNLPRDTSYDLMMCALYHRAFIADRPDDDEAAMSLDESPFGKPQKLPVVPPEANPFLVDSEGTTSHVVTTNEETVP